MKSLTDLAKSAYLKGKEIVGGGSKVAEANELDEKDKAFQKFEEFMSKLKSLPDSQFGRGSNYWYSSGDSTLTPDYITKRILDEYHRRSRSASANAVAEPKDIEYSPTGPWYGRVDKANIAGIPVLPMKDPAYVVDHAKKIVTVHSGKPSDVVSRRGHKGYDTFYAGTGHENMYSNLKANNFDVQKTEKDGYLGAERWLRSTFGNNWKKVLREAEGM